MKNRIIKLCLLLTVMAFATVEADAQAKKPSRTTKKRPTTTRKVVLPTGPRMPKTRQQLLLPVDTVKPARPPVAEIKIPTIKRSLRNDNAIRAKPGKRPDPSYL